MPATIRSIASTSFADQRPGTSGLRKRMRVFAQPHYLENYLQAMLDVLALPAGFTLVIGGDGRYGNRGALDTVVRMAIAAGAGTIIAGRDGILSTPAASHLIRLHRAAAGIILSASHNPAGPDGDFGVKLNVASGGPAAESLMEAIAGRTREITGYRIAEVADVPLHAVGTHLLDGTRLDVVDPVTSYADLMESLVDFDAIRALFASGFRMAYDAMHAVTGPYAHEILERRLGAPAGTVRNGTPREDFGGGHADPNLVHAHELVETMFAAESPDFGAASDGDGDRNMILGRGLFVTPSDSLAMIAANAAHLPMFRAGLPGVARSMPTSQAVDRVAAARGIDCYETPTGWKFFGTLLDSGRIALCGEESFGTGANHVREKDGLWAVLSWLNILAARRQSVGEVVREHWREFGRTYYTRHDYEEIPLEAGDAVMDHLRARIETLRGHSIGGHRVLEAGEYTYVDPVDGSTSRNQGLRIVADGGARIVVRLSGTGTAGATLRLYMELHEPDPSRQDRDTQLALAPLREAALALTELHERTGREAPSVVT